jgi:hypothetical protein
MADLPRYQTTGRVYSDLPQLDFANVRESFKQSQSLSNQLDRLSNYAFTEVGKTTEKAAEKFALDNPITIDQLKNAQSNGINEDDLIKASGGGRIWEETLRKFQGEQLRSQLEVHGQAVLTDILAQVERKELTDPAEIKQKFESAVTGFEKPLANINADSAIRFKQSMGATAGAFYKEATKKLTADYINDQQILTEENLGYSYKAAKAMVGTITDPTLLDEAKNLLFKRVYEQAREGGTEFAQTKANEFLKEFNAIKLNHFTEVATSDAYAKDIVTAAEKIRAGNFGESSELYASLPEEEKKKVRQNSLLAWSDVINATKQAEDYTKLQNKEADNNDVIKLYELPDNSKVKRNLARDLFKRGAITQSTLDGVLNPKGDDEAKGDPLAGAHAEADIIYGRITTESQLNALYPTLTRKQRATLITSMASKVVAKSKADIRIGAGAAEGTMSPIDLPTAKRIQSINELADGFKSTTNPDGSLKYSISEATKLAIQEYPKSEKFQESKKSQTSAYDAMKKNFAGFNPDTMTPDGYATRKGLNESELLALKRQYKNYQDKKSITGLGAGAL